MKIFALALISLISIHGYSQKVDYKFLIGKWVRIDSVRHRTDTLTFIDSTNLIITTSNTANDSLIHTAIAEYRLMPSSNNTDTLRIRVLSSNNIPVGKSGWWFIQYTSVVAIDNNTIVMTQFSNVKLKRKKKKRYDYYRPLVYRRKV